MKKVKWMLAAALGIIMACFFSSWFIQTGGGQVSIQPFSVITSEGGTISGQIFCPKQAGSETPAPAIVTCVGGNNSYSMMRNLNAELARAGYVVITYSSYKHGASGLMETDTMGASEILRYVQTLDFVDQNRIGVMGHTRGGSYLFKAALANGGVRAALKLDVVELFGSLYGYTPDTAINCGWIMSNYNEYSLNPRGYSTDPALQKVFGGDEEIETGVVYGDFSQRTARIVYAVDTMDWVYPFSTGYAAAMLDFFSRALDTPRCSPVPVWPLLEGISAISLVAMTAAMLALSALLLNRAGLLRKRQFPDADGVMHCRNGYVFLNLLIVAVPFLPLYMLGKRILEPNPLFPQNDTNGLTIWALFAGLLYWCLLFVRYRNRKNPGLRSRMAVMPEELASFFLAATLVFLGIYAVNWLGNSVLHTTFRLFCTYFEPLTLRRVLAACTCFPLFLLYFLLAEGFRTEPGLHFRGAGLTEYALGILFYAGGFVLLYGLNYLGFPLIGHSLFHGARFAFGPILAIVPGLIMAGIISVWGYRKTGKVYFAAFLNTFLFVWLLTGSNAFYYQ